MKFDISLELRVHFLAYGVWTLSCM